MCLVSSLLLSWYPSSSTVSTSVTYRYFSLFCLLVLFCFWGVLSVINCLNYFCSTHSNIGMTCTDMCVYIYIYIYIYICYFPGIIYIKSVLWMNTTSYTSLLLHGQVFLEHIFFFFLYSFQYQHEKEKKNIHWMAWEWTISSCFVISLVLEILFLIWWLGWRMTRGHIEVCFSALVDCAQYTNYFGSLRFLIFWVLHTGKVDCMSGLG